MKSSGTIALVLLTVTHLATSINVDCNYYNGDWRYLGNIYRCNVENDLAIKSREKSTITTISGTHSSGKGNDDVRVFSIDTKTVNYFPKGIEKIFKNLQGIQIYNSSLQELKQSDISVFPDLVTLNLPFNNLQVLEEGLFNFNPKLKVIYLYDNKISQIHPNVFVNLNQLLILELTSNTCINLYAYENAAEVEWVIQEVKSLCPYTASKTTTSTTTLAPDGLMCPASCHVKVLQSMDMKLAQIKNEIYQKMANMDMKLDKILKKLNILDDN